MICIEFISFFPYQQNFRVNVEPGSAEPFTLQVDFDKNKHLSDENIHKRHVEKERLKELEKQEISEECRKRYETDFFNSIILIIALNSTVNSLYELTASDGVILRSDCKK